QSAETGISVSDTGGISSRAMFCGSMCWQARRRQGSRELEMAKDYSPSMSDDAVKAKTGKDWKAWFALMDKVGADKLTHKDIAALLHDTYRVPGWWSQMVTVEYERARGLRVKSQTTGGFTLNASKTLPVDLARLYRAV